MFKVYSTFPVKLVCLLIPFCCHNSFNNDLIILYNDNKSGIQSGSFLFSLICHVLKFMNWKVRRKAVMLRTVEHSVVHFICHYIVIWI